MAFASLKRYLFFAEVYGVTPARLALGVASGQLKPLVCAPASELSLSSVPKVCGALENDSARKQKLHDLHVGRFL